MIRICKKYRSISFVNRIRNMKANTQQTLHYLQQLYVTKYGNFEKKVFQKRWIDFVEKYKNCDKKPLYIVSCDIEAAFDSIDQSKFACFSKKSIDDIKEGKRILYVILYSLRKTDKNY